MITSPPEHLDNVRSPVGWVKSAKSGLLTTNLFSLPDYIRIAESLNLTPNLSLSRYNANEKWDVSKSG
jgi:hypothetical protein